MAKKKLLLIISVVLLLLALNGGFVAMVLLEQPETAETSEPELSEEERAQLAQQQLEQQYRIRFTLSDAIDLCGQEVRSRNSNLIQLHDNALANRYIEDDGVYLVKFDTLVGTALNYEEKSHTCHIDPELQAVSYYQEIVRKRVIRPSE